MRFVLRKISSIQRISKFFFTPIILVLIQSCTNNPIGQQLSNSFDSPVEVNPSKNLVSQEDDFLSSNTPKKNLKESSSFNANLNQQKVRKSTSIIQLQKQIKSQKKVAAFTPQPYRITIKLSASNPSAPAETVTKALRNAGVSFEVEMIERIDPQSLIEDARSGRSKR